MDKITWIDEYAWEDANEDRVWYCAHDRAYGIRCSKCDEEDGN
jgi:hypothetical protein